MASSSCSGQCRPGSYGATSGLTHENCTGLYSAGFLCPAGSTSPVAAVCGDAAVYCPEGSFIPTVATEGYYTAGGASSSTRTHQLECERGHYCTGGVMVICPAGTYGFTKGLSTSDCSGPCPDGYYCVAGATDVGDGTIKLCGSAAVYCPSGSGLPQLVSTGFYSDGSLEEDRRPHQTECEAGYATLALTVFLSRVVFLTRLSLSWHVRTCAGTTVSQVSRPVALLARSEPQMA